MKLEHIIIILGWLFIASLLGVVLVVLTHM